MAEAFSPSLDAEEAEDIETLRSRLNLLFERVGEDTFGDEDTISEFESFLEEGVSELVRTRGEIELENENFSSLNRENSETVLAQLKRELSSVEDDCRNTKHEIADLMRAFHGDSAKLYGDLVALDLLFKPKNCEDLNKFQGPVLTGNEESNTVSSCNDNFKIFQLDNQIEKAHHYLNQLQTLDSIFIRNEALVQILEMLSEDVKPIECEGNCIRLSIRTPIFISDISLLGQKLDCIIEPLIVYHELVIEVDDETLKLKKIEIFPNDVCLDSVITVENSVRSSDMYTLPLITSSIESLVRNVNQKIFMCNVRHIVVKDANKSRHSFEYSDKDEMVIAHLVGGIDAFLKISLGWPMLPSGLHLISIKGLDIHSKDISLASLFKIKERANSLEARVRNHLLLFADAIEEILLQELHHKT